MHTIKENIINEIVIQKSRFITCLYKINNKDEVNKHLDKIKDDYPFATHYCYAYRLDNIEKCSDDGEPKGTAGTPILHVLQMNNLTNILCVVIRYFGGIKLGAGGLVRAYTKGVTESLKNVAIIPLIEGHKIQIIFEHSSLKQIDYLLKDYSIIKIYDTNIIYELSISKNELENVKNSLTPYIIEFKILEDIYI